MYKEVVMLYVNGRKVKIVTGTQSQTVRVMTSENIDGRFDYVLRLAPPVADLERKLGAQGFDTIEELVSYLKKTYYAQVEQTPATRPPSPLERLSVAERPSVPTAEPQPIKTAPLGAWEAEAIRLLEAIIDELVRGFIRQPYLHRVEHSLHCEFYTLLRQHKLFSDTYPMANTVTYCIHKEWPEWHTRPEKGTRHGEFDMAVVAPQTLARASLVDFIDGRLEPLAVVEFGLDYRHDHLAEDDRKLTNSEVQHGYLVHLVREGLSDDFDAVERLVLASRHRVAYARVGYGRSRCKLLSDTAIQEVAADF